MTTITIYRAANVITLDGADTEAFATANGRVLATGLLAELRAQLPAAEVVDLGAATVIPGFNDAHAHPGMCAVGSVYVGLNPADTPTADAVRTALAERAARTPAGEWVVGHDFDAKRTEGGQGIDRAFLDAVSSDHPILLIHKSYHSASANSPALAAAGYGEQSPDPVGGELVRDGAGNLTGLLHERAWFEGFMGFGGRTRLIPLDDLDGRVQALSTMLAGMNAAGITSVCDALTHPPEWRLFTAARERGALTARIGMLVWYDHIDTLAGLGLHAGFGDEWLRLTGVKMMFDGALTTGTCFCSEPYAGPDGPTTGLQVLTDAELDDTVDRVHSSGNRLAIHTNGDAGIDRVLRAIEAAQARDPRPTRHRIEHCSLVDDAIIARLAAAGVAAVPFGAMIGYLGDRLIDLYGEDRARRACAHGSLLAAGVPVGGSSDYTVGPYEPLLAMRSMVTRRTPGGVVLGPEQRLTARQALGVYTTGSAAASGEEQVKGKLAPGYLADFAVLAENPLEADPETLPDIPVLSTWIGGEQVWSAS
ncbi:MAG: amidohydrolase family protein [Streptosporangiales bacterium]|nr:amidohydrolase family protein [Streptosporangiales bacterium]